MKHYAAITVLRPRDEVQRLWQECALRPAYLDEIEARVTFRPAPGR